jgi:hypothetical protein
MTMKKGQKRGKNKTNELFGSYESLDGTNIIIGRNLVLIESISN